MLLDLYKCDWSGVKREVWGLMLLLEMYGPILNLDMRG